ncbi:MAG: ankyrin repeat domain-containing protein [Clostridium sp.]
MIANELIDLIFFHTDLDTCIIHNNKYIAKKLVDKHSLCNYIESNNLTVVKFLCSLDCVDPSAGDNLSVGYASQKGQLDVVKFLCSLDCVDPSACDNRAVILASANGHLEVVKFLCSLDCVDPSDVNNDAVRCASRYGHLDVVKFLCCSIE